MAGGFLGVAGGLWGFGEGFLPHRIALLLPEHLGLRGGMVLLYLLAAALIGATALARQWRGLYVSIVVCTWVIMLTSVVWVYTPQFNQRYPIRTFVAMVNAEVAPHILLTLCGPVNDLALRWNLGRSLPMLTEIPEVQAYLEGEAEVYCVMEHQFYQRLTAVTELPLAIKGSKRFGSTALLLVGNRLS